MAKDTQPAPTAPATPKVRTSLKVRAVKLGFYPGPGEVRARARQPGEVFELREPHHFAGPEKGAFQWMVWAEDAPPAAPAEPVSIMSVPNRLQQDPLRPGQPVAPPTVPDIQL